MSEWEEFLSRARRSAKQTAMPPVWRPQNVGDELFGVVVGVRPNPWDSSVRTYIVKTRSGDEYMTPRNEALVGELERLNPEVGDKIYIRYDGLGRARPGRNPPKLFSVYVEKAAGGPETPGPEPPEVSTAEEVQEVSKEPEPQVLPDVDYEKLRKYLLTLRTIYVMPLSWEGLRKQLESKGIFMSPGEVKKLPQLFPDILEATEDGKRVRFKK